MPHEPLRSPGVRKALRNLGGLPVSSPSSIVEAIREAEIAAESALSEARSLSEESEKLKAEGKPYLVLAAKSQAKRREFYYFDQRFKRLSDIDAVIKKIGPHGRIFIDIPDADFTEHLSW